VNLSQLILAVGDENVRFQSLDTSASRLDWSAKSGTKITFHTEEPITPGEGTVKLGLVLWFDREAVQSALSSGGAAFRRAATPEPNTSENPHDQ
jgi:hypothetical protein